MPRPRHVLALRRRPASEDDPARVDAVLIGLAFSLFLGCSVVASRPRCRLRHLDLRDRAGHL